MVFAFCSLYYVGMKLKVRYMLRKRLKNGEWAFYWNPPAAAVRAGLAREALGAERDLACQRALELNALFDAVRRPSGRAVRGMVSWGLQQYQHDELFTGLKPSTQRTYLQAIKHIETAFGNLPAKAVSYKQAKAFYQSLRSPGRSGRERLGQANGTLRVARLVWEFFINEEIAKDNPFRRVRLSTLPSRTVLWSRQQVAAFVSTSDKMGHPEIGTAVMLAFELCQREGDILDLSWDRIHNHRIQIRQNKTDTLVWLPLDDLPAVRARLGLHRSSHQHVLVQPDGRSWASDPHKFRKRFRSIADAAGLPRNLTFMDLRRAGLTELGEAGATDDELRSVSGHKTREIVAVYVLPTDDQARNAIEKRQIRRGKQA
jgi:Phage integrase family